MEIFVQSLESNFRTKFQSNVIFTFSRSFDFVHWEFPFRLEFHFLRNLNFPKVETIS